MRGARIPAVALGAILAAIGVGCSTSEPEETPVACLGGPDVYLQALQATPGKVRLRGTTPISDCLVPGQEAGDLADVGSAMVVAATRLNREARTLPSAQRAREVGYLVGAAESGAEDTSGIHQDLILRLNSAATYSPSGNPTQPFEVSFISGRRTGRDTG